jgi:hypothetical protein
MAVAALPVASAPVSPKRDLSGFAAPGGMPAPPPPPVVAPAVVGPTPEAPPKAHNGPATAPAGTAGTAGAATTAPVARAARAAKPGRSTAAPAKATGRGGGRPGRRRICVSLTIETSAQLAALAQARRSWKVEVVLEALAHWDARLRDGHESGERTRFRRRRSSTPTPFVMDLTPDELDRLDELARAVGSSRSALVRQLILLEAASLPGDTAGAPPAGPDR